LCHLSLSGFLLRDPESWWLPRGLVRARTGSCRCSRSAPTSPVSLNRTPVTPPILVFEYGMTRRERTARRRREAPITPASRFWPAPGLPGAGLWVLLWPVWFRHVVHWGIRRGRGGWTANAGLSALVLAAVVGYLANTYFDPSWMAQRALSGSGASWHWERVRSQEPLDRNEPPSCQLRRPAG
jgi:hypothetical protein